MLPADRAEPPREVRQNIDMESYRIQQTGSGKVVLERKPGTLDPVGTKGGHAVAPEELETLSRIIAELNERFGLNLGPEHRVTLERMMGKLDDDAALDAAARVNTRENVRLTFDQKVEHVIQEIVDSNFELYRRITDKFMRHLAQVVRNGLGDRAGTCIDPKTQIVQGKTVCLVSCQRSPEPVFLKWKGIEGVTEGDFFVRSGPGTVKLPPDKARASTFGRGSLAARARDLPSRPPNPPLESPGVVLDKGGRVASSLAKGRNIVSIALAHHSQ